MKLQSLIFAGVALMLSGCGEVVSDDNRRLIEGRWGSEGYDAVGIIVTDENLTCNFRMWELGGDGQEDLPCSLEPIDRTDNLVAEDAGNEGWSLVEAYQVDIEEVVVQAYIYDHPTEDSIMWMEEDGEDLFGDVWRKLPNPREMIKAGIGIAPSLSKEQRQCALEVIDEKVSDDLLDFIYDILPDRFEDDWDIKGDAFGFAVYLGAVCEIDLDELDMGTR